MIERLTLELLVELVKRDNNPLNVLAVFQVLLWLLVVLFEINLDGDHLPKLAIELVHQMKYNHTCMFALVRPGSDTIVGLQSSTCIFALVSPG
jgi:hypothetical protein